MPRPAPVTIATRPSHSRFMGARASLASVSAARWHRRSARHAPVGACRRGPVGRARNLDTVTEPPRTVAPPTPATCSSSARVPPASPPRSRCTAPAGRSSSSTRHGFPATSAAATVSRRWRSASSKRSVSSPDDVDDWYDVDAAWLRSPSGREVTVPLPDRGRYAAVAPRISLDHALVELARTDRASTCSTATASPRSMRPMPTTSTSTSTGIGTVRCRYVVAADGMWSPVRKAVGARIDGYRGEWHAFRQYARNVTGPRRRPADRVVRTRPAARVRLVVPAARQPGQHRLRRPPRRRPQGRATWRHLWRDLLARPHVVEALGRRRRARGSAHRMADSGSGRRRLAHARPHAVRRRRRGGHRRDDRRGHRPGAVDGPARRRGDRHRGRTRTRRRPHRTTNVPWPQSCSPTTACRNGSAPCCNTRSVHEARSASSGPAATGDAATSPAGCSRTSHARSPRHPGAGIATSSLGPAPTPTAEIGPSELWTLALVAHDRVEPFEWRRS